MSRIRSIHPGFWTDETIAGLSDAATLFYIGLLNEADDHGVFEWKPVTLRMRLRPSKDGPVDALLEELEAANVIRRFVVAVRLYGAIRNFCKYQRPKFPKILHPTSSEIANYVASKHLATETDTDEQPSPTVAEPTSTPPPTVMEPVELEPFPRNAEIAAQREEGEKEEGSKKASEAKASGAKRAPLKDEKTLFDRGKAVLGKGSGGLISKLLKAKEGSISATLAVIELAACKQDPAEYIGAVLRAPAGATINADGSYSRWAL